MVASWAAAVWPEGDSAHRTAMIRTCVWPAVPVGAAHRRVSVVHGVSRACVCVRVAQASAVRDRLCVWYACRVCAVLRVHAVCWVCLVVQGVPGVFYLHGMGCVHTVCCVCTDCAVYIACYTCMTCAGCA